MNGQSRGRRYVRSASTNGLMLDIAARLFRANSGHSAVSLDHLIGELLQGNWNKQPKLLCRS